MGSAAISPEEEYDQSEYVPTVTEPSWHKAALAREAALQKPPPTEEEKKKETEDMERRYKEEEEDRENTPYEGPVSTLSSPLIGKCRSLVQVQSGGWQRSVRRVDRLCVWIPLSM